MTMQEAITVMTAYPSGMWDLRIVEWRKARDLVLEAADEILRREALADGKRG